MPLTPNTSYFDNFGHCPVCDSDVTFVSNSPWFRDNYICVNCKSIPRERALMTVVETNYPNWRELKIHESSPVYRGASARFKQECSNYIASQYYLGKEPGSSVNGFRCENLESLTFADNSVDIHITQDVFEHVFNPYAAFKEIARTLRRGGAHIFTVPLVNKTKPSKRRALIDGDGIIAHLESPVYHGNPVSKEGSLVTVDWGFDICCHIFEACKLFTSMIHIDDLNKGIRAEYIEVLMTVKPESAINVISEPTS